MAQKKHSAACHPLILGCLAFCTCSFGQVQSLANRQPAPTAAQMHAQSSKPSPVVAPTSANLPPSSPATVPSLLDHPAQPAKVILVSGRLTVEANNSSLSEILHQVSEAGGMKVEGLQSGGNASQRIFGSYGPGAPRDVLSDILNGSGYNVMMLGETPSGTPRELTLTARAGGTPIPSPQAGNSVRNEDNDDAIQPTQYSQEQENRPDTPPIPPGTPNGVRTPQQMLENLQRLRDLQQEQQQQQDQQPN